MNKSDQNKYWKTNLKYVAILLSIWFVVSYGFGIILVDELNSIRIGGFKLGFWFAQQGSIYVFTILIFVYVRLMNKLDAKYNLDKHLFQESLRIFNFKSYLHNIIKFKSFGL